MTQRLIYGMFFLVIPVFGIVMTVPQELIRHPRLFNRDSSTPFISGDTFRSIADHIVDETCVPCDTQCVKQGDIIFVKVDYLNFFFTKIHPHISVQYILVSHNGDCPAPGSFIRYLDDPKIIAWFGQNGDIAYHPKFFPIPIGFANQCWSHGKVTTFYQAQSYAESFPPKKYLLYLNFSERTHKERERACKLFARASYATMERSKPHDQYLKDLAQSRFVVCPRGNGLDCHRTWEALLMGAVPVLKHSTLDPLFEGLPVVLVHDWHEVNQEFLQNTYERMQRQTFERERIFARYWLDKILEVKRRAQTH